MRTKIFFALFMVTLITNYTYGRIVTRPQSFRPNVLLSGNSTSTMLIPIAQPAAGLEKNIFKWFRTFSEAVYLVAKKHYREIDVPTFIQDALKSACAGTGPHTSFFAPKSYTAALESTSGKFSGIGVSIMNKAPEDDSLAVIDVIQGGPSHKAGLQPGDKIVGVNGESLKGLSSDEVVTKLRGKINTEVKIKVIRKKEPKSFTIIREVIKDQNLMCYHFEDQNIYYFSLKLFADNTHKQMTKLLNQAMKNKCKGIIIDLRRNPGGVLDAAVNMAGLFVEKGSLVVSTKDKNDSVINAHHTTSNPIFTRKKPIFIVTDNFTASASEIFAGCLKHYSDKNFSNLAVYHVGTETFGKGSVQEVIPISNGCALKMTTMTYILSDDSPIQAKGIKPDFLVEAKVTNEKEDKWIKELYGKESSLKNYIKPKGFVEEQKKPDFKPEEESKEEIAKNWEQNYIKALGNDTQVQACINMINLMNLANSSRKGSPKKLKTRADAINFLNKNYLIDNKAKLAKVS